MHRPWCSSHHRLLTAATRMRKRPSQDCTIEHVIQTTQCSQTRLKMYILPQRLLMGHLELHTWAFVAPITQTGSKVLIWRLQIPHLCCLNPQHCLITESRSRIRQSLFLDLFQATTDRVCHQPLWQPMSIQQTTHLFQQQVRLGHRLKDPANLVLRELPRLRSRNRLLTVIT